MTRGRKRRPDKTIPAHIDQSKLPNGCYWNRRDRYWYAYVDDAKPRMRRLGAEEALLSDLHHAIEQLHGIERDTLDYLLKLHQGSPQFEKLAKTTQDDYIYCRTILQNFRTKLGIPFSSVKLRKITLPLIQVLIDDIAMGKRSFDHEPSQQTPSSAAHVQRYLSAAFAWGMPRGHCTGNPADGIDMPKERKAHRMPDALTMKAVVALFKRRGALPSRRTGSLAPYVWAVAVIAYTCRMRGVEVRELTDADETKEGIIVDRRKGSLGNITRWSPELKEAWDWLKTRRNRIWEKKRYPIPHRAADRPLVVTEGGSSVSKFTMSSAWRRAMAAALKAGVISKEERFGLHGLKHRGITDTKGTKADKQLASGHRSIQMVHLYDHERPVVDPAGKA